MLRKPVIFAVFLLALAALACGTASQSGNPPENPPESQSGDPLEDGERSGEQVFRQLGCGECHNAVMAVAAPSLEGVYGSPVELESGETVTADEDYLRESILSPGAKIVRGYQPIMPDFSSQLSDEEVAALVEYIRGLAE